MQEDSEKNLFPENPWRRQARLDDGRMTESAGRKGGSSSITISAEAERLAESLIGKAGATKVEVVSRAVWFFSIPDAESRERIGVIYNYWRGEARANAAFGDEIRKYLTLKLAGPILQVLPEADSVTPEEFVKAVARSLEQEGKPSRASSEPRQRPPGRKAANGP